MRPLALLDTSVLILLLTSKQDESADEVENDRKRSCVRDALTEMQKTWKLAIPAVVVAELSRTGDAGRELEKLVKEMGKLRVEQFGHDAALVASTMAGTALTQRPQGAERGAIKYDLLICATAVASRATRIVTENPRDFRKHLDTAVAPDVEVYVPSNPEKSGQLRLMQVPPKG